MPTNSYFQIVSISKANCFQLTVCLDFSGIYNNLSDRIQLSLHFKMCYKNVSNGRFNEENVFAIALRQCETTKVCSH